MTASIICIGLSSVSISRLSEPPNGLDTAPIQLQVYTECQCMTTMLRLGRPSGLWRKILGEMRLAPILRAWGTGKKIIRIGCAVCDGRVGRLVCHHALPPLAQLARLLPVQRAVGKRTIGRPRSTQNSNESSSIPMDLSLWGLRH
jgi:hypothetical protein